MCIIASTQQAPLDLLLFPLLVRSSPVVEDFYTLGRPLSCDVLFLFLLEVPVTNRVAQKLQYQPHGR